MRTRDAASSAAASAPQSPHAWQAQFLLLACVWGSSFICIKVLGERWPPLWVALGRVTLGAACLVALLLWRRERLPSDLRVWGHLAVTAALWNVLPFTLFAYGETKVSSVVAGLWNATVPLWALAIVLLVLPAERPTRARIAGLGIGFLGVVLVLAPWRGVGGEALGQLACAAATMCYGIGFPYLRRNLSGRPESGVVLTTGQLLCAVVELAIFAPFVRAPTTDLGAAGFASLLALGALGTGIAYVLNYAVIRAAGLTTASTVSYVIPIVSTVLGVAVLGEALRWSEPVGAAVILLGTAITQNRLPLRR